MKRDFKKMLKKGICLGMAGAMIITGSPHNLGVHPVMKVEASTTDIATASSKEEALEHLCDKAVLIVHTVRENYESILTDFKNLESDFDNSTGIEREIYKEYSDVLGIVIKVQDSLNSELWNYTTKSNMYTEKHISTCKQVLENEIIKLKSYNDESLNKYNEISEQVNAKLKDLKEKGSSNWEPANIANQKCMDMLKIFFQNYTSKIESMKASYQELEEAYYEYTNIQNNLPQNTVKPTPTLTPIVTLKPTATVSYSKTSVTINIKSNAGTYIKSAILTRISNGKESVHGDYNTGVSIQNAFAFGCDSNSTVTIKNITLSNGKTFPDISFWVGTTDVIYDLDLTSYEDYIVPIVTPTVEPTIIPTVEPTQAPVTVNVLYSANGGSFVNSAVLTENHVAGSVQIITADKFPSKDGYIFCGFTSLNGTIVYDAANNLCIYTVPNNNDVLTAQWKTVEPMITPTTMPTEEPMITSTTVPTEEPMITPITIPTEEPAITPMTIPTEEPAITPMTIPTEEPTIIPTTIPIEEPTMTPQVTTQPAISTKPVSLKKKIIRIGKGEKVAIPFNNGTSKKITYSSKNKKIATVTSKGIVKGVKAGTTTINVKIDGKNYNLKVKVKKKPTKIKINSVSKVKMGIGDRLILQAVLNRGAASYCLTWKSSNKKVVTVNSKGVATIKGKGKATITVKTYNGVKAKLNLNIK